MIVHSSQPMWGWRMARIGGRSREATGVRSSSASSPPSPPIPLRTTAS